MGTALVKSAIIIFMGRHGDYYPLVIALKTHARISSGLDPSLGNIQGKVAFIILQERSVQ